MMESSGFLIDTNVVSELMRPDPEPRVLQWVNLQPDKRLYLSTTILAELLSGLARMPDGQGKLGFEELLRRLRGEEDAQSRWPTGRLQRSPLCMDLRWRLGTRGRLRRLELRS
jgi:predicted nucleic acid-binding protein